MPLPLLVSNSVCRHSKWLREQERIRRRDGFHMRKFKAITYLLILLVGSVLMAFWLLHAIEGIFLTAPCGLEGLSNHLSSCYTYLESSPDGLIVRHRTMTFVWPWFIAWLGMAVCLCVVGFIGVRKNTIRA